MHRSTHVSFVFKEDESSVHPVDYKAGTSAPTHEADDRLGETCDRAVFERMDAQGRPTQGECAQDGEAFAVELASRY